MTSQNSKTSQLRDLANEGGRWCTYSQSTSYSVSRFHRSQQVSQADRSQKPFVQLGNRTKAIRQSDKLELRQNAQVSISFNFYPLYHWPRTERYLFLNFNLLSYSRLTCTTVLIYRSHNLVCSWPCVTGHWASSVQSSGMLHLAKQYVQGLIIQKQQGTDSNQCPLSHLNFLKRIYARQQDKEILEIYSPWKHLSSY